MEAKVLREVFINEIYKKMATDDKIFFLSADFGSIALDKLREKFKDRFINVGIAEQDLINISTGVALEGFTVYAYAIAPFLAMRCYEQIRTNLALMSQLKEININMVSVGAGLSYDVTGPTHHCLEDIAIMRLLPNIVVFSPSDYIITEKFIDYSINVKKPKYIRLDGKALGRIYNNEPVNIADGFFELRGGDKVCIVSTGYMTHKALKIAEDLSKEKIDIGIIDAFLLKPISEGLLFDCLSKYKCIITMEEGFINKGGMDCLIACILRENNSSIRLRSLGFGEKYVFEVGSREYLHKINGLDKDNIVKIIKEELKIY